MTIKADFLITPEQKTARRVARREASLRAALRGARQATDALGELADAEDTLSPSVVAAATAIVTTRGW